MRIPLSTSLALAAALTAGCTTETANTEAISPQLARMEVELEGTNMKVHRALSNGNDTRDPTITVDGRYLCTIHGVAAVEAEKDDRKNIVLHDDSTTADGYIDPRNEYFERYPNAAAAAGALKDGSYIQHRDKFKALDK